MHKNESLENTLWIFSFRRFIFVDFVYILKIIVKNKSKNIAEKLSKIFFKGSFCGPSWQ